MVEVGHYKEYGASDVFLAVSGSRQWNVCFQRCVHRFVTMAIATLPNVGSLECFAISDVVDDFTSAVYVLLCVFWS